MSSTERDLPSQWRSDARTRCVPNGADWRNRTHSGGGGGDGCQTTTKLVTMSSRVRGAVLPWIGTTCGRTRGWPTRTVTAGV